MTNTVQRPQFGDIYFANLIGGNNLQKGIRPVLIVQNNIGNRYSSTFEVLPLSSRVYKARYMPTHVLVHAHPMNGLRRDSVVLAEQPKSSKNSMSREEWFVELRPQPRSERKALLPLHILGITLFTTMVTGLQKPLPLRILTSLLMVARRPQTVSPELVTQKSL